MFHRVRSEVLQTALGRLEPRPLGRPAQHPSPEDLRMAELDEENQHSAPELAGVRDSPGTCRDATTAESSRPRAGEKNDSQQRHGRNAESKTIPHRHSP